ncbi:MAG: FAD/NAD(P)-binding protein, partial [Byssovorax sp.]
MSASGAETLVVGGGISGLYADLLLARRGKRARVIERSAGLGGLSGAEEFRGVACDLGSHRL